MRDSGGWTVVRRARWAVSAYFLVMGLTGGTWMARIPAAKAQAHLSDGMLGAALFAVPAGLMLGAALAERLVDRIGSAPVTRVSGVGNCLLLLAPGLASSLPELMAALFGFGLASGALDVAQNAQGVLVEAACRKPIVTSMHAFFSFGAIAGALAGGGLAWAGVTLLPSLAVAGVLGAGVEALAGRWLLPGTRYDPATAHAELASAAPPVTPSRDKRHPRRILLAIGFIGVCGLVGEGAAGDWSAVYLKDSLGASAGFAAVAFAAFSVTMTAGRAVGDQLIRRFGVVPVIRACGVAAAAGLAGALMAASPVVAVAGFAVFGAGLSVVVPQVFAAGGRVDPTRPGTGIARVVGLGYAGQTAGPAVIGVLAAETSLRLALTVPAVLALWIAVGASALAVSRDAGAAERSHATFRDDLDTLAMHEPQQSVYRYPMDDREILARINNLIKTERELRSRLVAGRLISDQEQDRLRSAEEALDQCWDLLRQRRARREFGQDPDSAAERPVTEVEGYQQLPHGTTLFPQSRDGIRGSHRACGYGGDPVRGTPGIARSPVGSQASGGTKEHGAYREIRHGRWCRLWRR